ncbi:hypothetical protein GOP47_0018667 [Adiantum capillus-veneris]|uniref:Uncharacterized protein n=1 Tax=Adiantum capillus-veneris TaxID=13818 RepID=A0A9D4UDL5_ADICA|nr:hypothetical protein GOP47_0018667 [Adiantum capillus-veneris]
MAMAMVMTPSCVQQTLRARSNPADWQNRVQRLWGFRRQHWENFRKGKSNAVPTSASATPRCLTARSAPELRPLSAHHLKPLLPQKSRPFCSVANSARSHSKPSTPFYKPSAWKEELVPVPLGLATQTQSQLLVGLVTRGSEAFLEQLQRPHKSYANFQLLKLGPRLSGFGSKPSPASQAALEQSLKKEQLRHRAPIDAGNVAFGRSNYGSFLTRNSDKTPRKLVGQEKPTTADTASACRARRDVINTIQEYHINAEVCAQLTKHAENAQSERRVSSARSLRRESLFQ